MNENGQSDRKDGCAGFFYLVTIAVILSWLLWLGERVTKLEGQATAPVATERR